PFFEDRARALPPSRERTFVPAGGQGRGATRRAARVRHGARRVFSLVCGPGALTAPASRGRTRAGAGSARLPRRTGISLERPGGAGRYRFGAARARLQRLCLRVRLVRVSDPSRGELLREDPRRGGPVRR